ncbi:uncharacterized protein AB675_7823 [Cyphellophora attinorum]|uniref:Uncharacterized protein n=1 Tax=Cyphellophora attinorum TaxID=1664694 RepID=A0A0N0NMJ3_9EURO|nr:uncharacterized protein AB675_7823 [Phialophora attinorum]KPI40269.1 hypothetical protein AB675_7823 [Phialophora attinorum]
MDYLGLSDRTRSIYISYLAGLALKAFRVSISSLLLGWTLEDDQGRRRPLCVQGPCQQDPTGCDFVKDYKDEFDVATATRLERPVQHFTLLAIQPPLRHSCFGQGDTAELSWLRSRRHCRTVLASVKATLQNCPGFDQGDTAELPALFFLQHHLLTSFPCVCAPQSTSTPASTTTTTRFSFARGESTSAINYHIGEAVPQRQSSARDPDAIRTLIRAAATNEWEEYDDEWVEFDDEWEEFDDEWEEYDDEWEECDDELVEARYDDHESAIKGATDAATFHQLSQNRPTPVATPILHILGPFSGTANSTLFCATFNKKMRKLAKSTYSHDRPS